MDGNLLLEWALNLMVLNGTRKYHRAVRLPEGDLAKARGDGTSTQRGYKARNTFGVAAAIQRSGKGRFTAFLEEGARSMEQEADASEDLRRYQLHMSSSCGASATSMNAAMDRRLGLALFLWRDAATQRCERGYDHCPRTQDYKHGYPSCSVRKTVERLLDAAPGSSSIGRR